jgi:hypothetical protein
MEIRMIKDVKTIIYNGVAEPHNVYEIPLEKLIYNKYNGRIKSIVKSYESGLGRKLDAKNEVDANIIESFLYDSAEYRNEKTIQSLKDYGQQEVGIVTKDMIIIDGNRRASLLKKLYREHNGIPYFKAIILQDNLEDKTLEIIKLETSYQMGVDNKVEYKPIEKYLRCQELVYEFKIDISEVAKLMSEKPTRIEQWLDILKLMDEYLIYIGSPNVYTRLDKTEGHFVDLYNYIKKYTSQVTSNIDELKRVYFDYIRLGLPVQRLRVIGNPKTAMSLFTIDDYWKFFYAKHIEITSSNTTNNFTELKSKHPEKSNEDIFTKLDSDYRMFFDEELKENLVAGEIFIKSLHEKKSILKELNRIVKSLAHLDINDNVLSEREEIIRILDNIIDLSNSIKNRL